MSLYNFCYINELKISLNSSLELIPELNSRKGTKFKIKNDSHSMMLGHKPSLAIVCGVAACSKLLTTRVCGLAACHKLPAPSCLILE